MSDRYRDYLKTRYRLLLGYVGGIWAIIGLAILAPLLILPFYPDDVRYAPGLLISGLPLLVLGVFLRRRYRNVQQEGLNLQEGMVVILVAWLVAIVAGAIPFMFESDLNFTQAVFEATSGWTTTGLSVVDVTQTPHLILLYRSVMQLIGGAGFAIIVLSAIAGPTGSGVSVAEGRDDQLVPHVRQSAELVLGIYIVYAVGGIIALMVAGMDWFDAINHAFAAISTGGFSTRPESIGYYNNVAVEAVIIVLMLLGTLNYLTAYVLLRGKFGPVLRNGEIRLMGVLLPVAILLLLLITLPPLYADFGKQLRVAIFETTSALSTTGFSTVSYLNWGDFGWQILIMLMLIGGGSGSTAGGIKQFRIYVLCAALYWQIRRAFLPQGAVNKAFIWRGESRSVLNDEQVRRIALFVFFYMVFFFIGTTILVAHGYSLPQSLFEFASTTSTVGLSVGITSPEAPPLVLWTQILGMILGRLEYFAVVIGLIKLFGDVRIISQPAIQKIMQRD